MNGQKITNVQNGDISATSKDAINGGQLYTELQARTYEGGNGVKIEDSASGTGKTISVDNGNGLEFGGTGGRQLTVKADETKGIAVSADGVAVKLASDSNLTFDTTTGGLGLSKELTGLTSVQATGDISGGTGTFNSTVTVGKTGDSSGIVIGNGKIAGLVTTLLQSESDAVSVGYLEKYVENGTGKNLHGRKWYCIRRH